MRITIRRIADGKTPQTAMPVAKVRLAYFEGEPRPDYIIFESGIIHRQRYAVMHTTDNPAYMYVRITSRSVIEGM